MLDGALVHTSPLRAAVKPGLQGLGKYSDRVHERQHSVIDSLDLDESTRLTDPQASRWDYVLGAKATLGATTGMLVGVEVHSATDGEVRAIIAKKKSSKAVLQAHLKPGTTVSRWCWVASGKVKFTPNSKYRRLLAQEGIEFVGGSLAL